MDISADFQEREDGQAYTVQAYLRGHKAREARALTPALLPDRTGSSCTGLTGSGEAEGGQESPLLPLVDALLVTALALAPFASS